MKKHKIKQKIIKNRHDFIYKILIRVIRPYLKHVNYTYDKPRHIPGPFIALSNHNTDLDTMLVSVCFLDQMYYIASENCFRKGFKSKVLAWAFGPISKIKGASDTLAVMKAIRYLKEGKNICIFPEGGRSFTGITTPVQVATGKLVKISGASLVTFKIQGAYLKIPRWGFGMRDGSWNGKFVNIYTPEQLKNMTPEEITDCINRDLYEHAYETQAANPVKYDGENLALGLECGVCICPECKSIGKLKTEGDDIFCTKCNMRATVGEYAFFNDGFKFKSVAQWDEWQEKYFRENVCELYDDDVMLRTFDSEHNTVELGKGRFELKDASFIFTPTGKEPVVLPIADIPDASVFSRSNFNFTNNKDGLHYELYADRLINVRKYFSNWKICREKY